MNPNSYFYNTTMYNVNNINHLKSNKLLYAMDDYHLT